MADFSVNAPHIVSRLIVNVIWKRHRQAMFRIRLSILLIRFAVWVGGFGGVNVSEDQS